jgi:hypothetical protein
VSVTGFENGVSFNSLDIVLSTFADFTINPAEYEMFWDHYYPPFIIDSIMTIWPPRRIINIPFREVQLAAMYCYTMMPLSNYGCAALYKKPLVEAAIDRHNAVVTWAMDLEFLLSSWGRTNIPIGFMANLNFRLEELFFYMI